MCKIDEVFQKTANCDSDEWCTGPANEENATIGSRLLCTKGKYMKDICYILDTSNGLVFYCNS